MSRPIILIFTHRPPVDDDERLAFRQALKVFAGRELRLVGPTSLNLSEFQKIARDCSVEFTYDSFPNRYFTSVFKYNCLKLSRKFYLKYREFDYMLTYELDAMVFRDELDDWCERGFDYIGAPWFEGGIEANRVDLFRGVGNAGFSLRRVSACLNILERVRPEVIRAQILRYAGYLVRKPLLDRYLERIEKPHLQYLVRKNRYEDMFWSMGAREVDPDFMIGSYEDALRFSWEACPAQLAEAGHPIPFGAHAWAKADRNFWLEQFAELGITNHGEKSGNTE